MVKCKYCGNSELLVLSESGQHKAINCGFCGKWIKWVGKKELKELEIMNNTGRIQLRVI